MVHSKTDDRLSELPIQSQYICILLFTGISTDLGTHSNIHKPREKNSLVSKISKHISEIIHSHALGVHGQNTKLVAGKLEIIG